MRCFQLISLAAVTAPLHQHNHDTPYLNCIIFPPSFLGRSSSSSPTQEAACFNLEMAGAAWFLQSGAHRPLASP
jgi:hypothetical protein